MADQLVHGGHSCCGVRSLITVRKPKLVSQQHSLAKGYSFHNSDVYVERGELLPFNPDANPVNKLLKGGRQYSWLTTEAKGYIMQCFVPAGVAIPDGYTVRATSRYGSLCTKVGADT